MMAKVDVKGDEHPVYAWLTQKELNGSGDHNVLNYKFLQTNKAKLWPLWARGRPAGEEVLAFAEGR